MVRRAAPHRAVSAIEDDGVDRSRGLRLRVDLVAHRAELPAHPLGDLLVDRQPARLARVVAERAFHLIAHEVRRFGGLLGVHAELHDAEKELQQVLVLRVAALDGGGQIGSAVLDGEGRGERDPRALARGHDVERVLAVVEDQLPKP